ncbi:PHP domain-containing protein [Azomonas agilis]|nr:PHP domain-containing protein [Azomonas agilis]
MMDLHCHSTASDGVLTPTALVDRAAQLGIRLLSLTDHDTIEGLAEARRAAETLGVTLVNGIELSCTWGGVTIHVLGYGFQEQATALVEALDHLHSARWQRAELIGERLAAKGMSGAFEGARFIQQELGVSNNAPARPHFAEFLVQAGYVRDRNEAFRKWLGAGKLGDIKHHWPTLAQTVMTLKNAAAWISLAHPWQYALTGSKRRRLVADFVQSGGQALEVVNAWQPMEQIGVLARLTRDFNLLASAGSDFHAPGLWSELGLYRPLPEGVTPLWPYLEGYQQHHEPAFTDTSR